MYFLLYAFQNWNYREIFENMYNLITVYITIGFAMLVIKSFLNKS